MRDGIRDLQYTPIHEVERKAPHPSDRWLSGATTEQIVKSAVKDAHDDIGEEAYFWHNGRSYPTFA
jgi:hypothetical protein